MSGENARQVPDCREKIAAIELLRSRSQSAAVERLKPAQRALRFFRFLHSRQEGALQLAVERITFQGLAPDFPSLQSWQQLSKFKSSLGQGGIQLPGCNVRF